MGEVTDLKKLYELDDSQWLEETIELLKKQQFDVINLVAITQIRRTNIEH